MKNKEPKGFFIEKYKNLIIFVYIMSAMICFANYYFKVAHNNSVNIFNIRGLAASNTFLFCSDIAYVFNYKKLVKEGKVENTFPKFALGALPLVVATITNILVLIFV